MKNSNNTYLAPGFLIVGIFLGWVIFGTKDKNIEVSTNLNTQMEEEMGKVMEDLQSKNGGDFDKVFLEYLSTHQFGDMNIAGVAMDKSSNQKVKDFAGYILTSTASNYETIKKLQQETK